MKAIFVILTATVFSSVSASLEQWEVQISKDISPEKCESIVENIKVSSTTPTIASF